MAVEHKDIVDAERHPPKGASTAVAGTVPVSDGAGDVTWTTPEPKGVIAASAGQVYVADGAGGGSQEFKTGWQQVVDDQYTSSAKLSVSSGVRTKVTINAATDLGENIDVWNPSTNKLEPEGENYVYHIRFVCKAASGSATPYVDIDYDIGGTPGVILQRTVSLVKGTSVTNNIVHSCEVYAGSTFIVNGMEIYLTPSANMDFWDFGLLIVRSHRANAG